MSKILVPVISVVAAGAVSFGIVKFSGNSDSQEQIEKLRSELNDQKKALGDQLRAAEEEKKRHADELAFQKSERDKAEKRAREVAANAEANAGIVSEPVDETRDKKGAEAIRNFAQALDRGLNNPEARNALRSRQTRGISGAYEGLYKKLNLAPADQQVVSELISDRNTAAFDKARKLFGGTNDDATIAATRQEIQATKAEYDTKLRGVVGEQKFNEISAYERTIGEQRSVDSFARNLERKGTPLEPDKKDALLSIMQNERLKVSGDEIPDIGGGPGMAVLLTEAEAKSKQLQEDQFEASVMAQAAQAGLTPDQVAALQEQFKERRDGQAIGRAVGRAFLGGGLDKIVPPKK